MKRPKEYPAQCYCGCCGREIASAEKGARQTQERVQAALAAAGEGTALVQAPKRPA